MVKEKIIKGRRRNDHASYLKGFAYTLEAMLAITMVIIFTVLLFSTTQAPVSANTALIKRQGFEALEFLEQTGELRELVFTTNENKLETRLRELLPAAITVETDVCTTACSGNLPQGKTVVAVDYYVSGYADFFLAKKVKLWMWGSF